MIAFTSFFSTKGTPWYVRNEERAVYKNERIRSIDHQSSGLRYNFFFSIGNEQKKVVQCTSKWTRFCHVFCGVKSKSKCSKCLGRLKPARQTEEEEEEEEDDRKQQKQRRSSRQQKKKDKAFV